MSRNFVALLLQASLCVNGEDGEGRGHKEADNPSAAWKVPEGQYQEPGEDGKEERTGDPGGKILLASDFSGALTWANLIPGSFITLRIKSRNQKKTKIPAQPETRRSYKLWSFISRFQTPLLTRYERSCLASLKHILDVWPRNCFLQSP